MTVARRLYKSLGFINRTSYYETLSCTRFYGTSDVTAKVGLVFEHTTCSLVITLCRATVVILNGHQDFLIKVVGNS